MTKRIAFFDSHTANYQALINQLQPNTEVVILHERYDGIEQILSALQDKSNLVAIDIISHGSPGSITLGSGVLNTSNLDHYTEQLFQIGRYLAEDGDIFLYGCKVAKGEIGLDFIEQLSQLTYSHVAASTSLTGATELGGNWLLEAQTGSIQSQAMEFDYDNVLADDYLDTVDTTGSITIGESSSGIIEELDDLDWFRMVLETGYVYEFEVSSDTLTLIDTTIHTASGSPISGVEDISENGYTLHRYSPNETGVHYLNIFAQSETGSYVISATKKNAFDDDDYSSTINTTGSLTIGGSTSGIISKPINSTSIFIIDYDWFKVSLTAGQTYQFQTNALVSLKLYNGDGDLLENHILTNGEINLVYTATETDAHYIEVDPGPSLRDSFSYTISATQIIDDYSNTADTTGIVTINGNTSGNIEKPRDVDWLQVSLTAGRSYDFQINSDSIEPRSELYNSSGAFSFELRGETVIQTGTYYLAVSSDDSNKTGSYTISATDITLFLDDYSDTTATTGSIETGGRARGIIDDRYDSDWFQVSLTAGKMYEFRVPSEEFLASLTLFDANGDPLGESSFWDFDSNGNPRGEFDFNASGTRNFTFAGLDFTATNTGTYYLGVGLGGVPVSQQRGFTLSESERDHFETVGLNKTGNYTISVSENSSSILPADRIFNWAESVFPDLLTNHQESTEILGYYARIYDNGNAVGELDDDLYFYDGDSISLVGTVDNYLSNAIEAGF